MILTGIPQCSLIIIMIDCARLPHDYKILYDDYKTLWPQGLEICDHDSQWLGKVAEHSC